jgi:hypothetical protein
MLGPLIAPGHGSVARPLHVPSLGMELTARSNRTGRRLSHPRACTGRCGDVAIEARPHLSYQAGADWRATSRRRLSFYDSDQSKLGTATPSLPMSFSITTPPSMDGAPSSSTPALRESVHSRLGPTSHVGHAASPAGAAATHGVVPYSPLSTMSAPLEIWHSNRSTLQTVN